MRPSVRATLPLFLPLILIISVSILPLRAEPFQHSYAVVVGINDYSSAHWRHLDYAQGDAKAVADRLKSQHYTVTELYGPNATKHNILAALYALGDKLGADDRVVVFVSTHGTSKRVGAKTFGYIVPFDGVDDVSYISDAELDDASAHLQTARHQLFILDACYGGLMLTRGGVPP